MKVSSNSKGELNHIVLGPECIALKGTLDQRWTQPKCKHILLYSGYSKCRKSLKIKILLKYLPVQTLMKSTI